MLCIINRFTSLLSFTSSFSTLHNTKVKIKNPYYRKKGFWEWRRRLIYLSNKRRYLKNFILPRTIDSNENPIKGYDNRTWTFTVENIPIRSRSLKNYCKLFSNLHVQDALDWLASLPKINTNMLLNSISKSRNKIVDEFDGDSTRLYIDQFIINYKSPIRRIKMGWGGCYRLTKTPRNNVMYRIREISMEEFYQKIFILGNIPRSMGAELRSHIAQRRVNLSSIVEWYPYLTSHTRYHFRKHLKYLNSIHQFDYYSHRREWISKYNENLERRRNQLREQYNLPIVK